MHQTLDFTFNSYNICDHRQKSRVCKGCKMAEECTTNYVAVFRIFNNIELILFTIYSTTITITFLPQSDPKTKLTLTNLLYIFF